MNRKEAVKKCGIAAGSSREGGTPKGVIHHMLAAERGFDRLVAHGKAPEGKTPERLNNMLGAERMAIAAKQKGLNL